MIFSGLLPFFENLTLKFCKCDILESIKAKLCQLMEDEE